MDTIFFLFITIAAVLLLFNVFLLIYSLGLSKKLNLLFQGKKVKNLGEVILNQAKKTKEQESEIIRLFQRVEKLQNISEKTFQKIGVIRFNPFNDIGGNQSFVIALLDSQNNGFVISSLFIKEGNRVYAKAIQKGQCEYPLSNEEKQAIEKAIG